MLSLLTPRLSLFVLLALIVLSGWSIFLTRPPQVKPATAPPTEFSAERAMLYVRQIAREPHAMGTPDHARVRGYLVNTLRSLGLDPQVQEATATGPMTSSASASPVRCSAWRRGWDMCITSWPGSGAVRPGKGCCCWRGRSGHFGNGGGISHARTEHHSTRNNMTQISMKLSLLILWTAYGIGIACAQSTSDSVATRRNSIKISPVSLLVGDVSLFYERVLTKRTSLVGGVGFGSEEFSYPNNKANVPSPGTFHYERLTLEYRLYFSRRHLAPSGFYAGVYGRFARLTLDDYQFDSQGQFIRDQNGTLVKPIRQLFVWIPGAMIGWQATPKRMIIDLFFGLQYQIPTSSTPLRSITPLLMSTQQLTPRYGFTVGYRF